MTSREQELKNISFDLYELFFDELIEEAEKKKPQFKRRLKTCLFNFFEYAEFELNFKGELLDSFCEYLKYIYLKIFKKLDEWNLE